MKLVRLKNIIDSLVHQWYRQTDFFGHLKILT